MTKVYIVQSSDYDDTTIWSVHASRETADAEKARRDDEARAKARRLAERWRTRHPDDPLASDEMIDDWRDHYMVSEWDVQS